MTTTEHRMIGKSTRRADSPAKLTGQERFAGDLAITGLLHARPVISHYAHARLNGVNTDAARQLPGVVAVLTAADLPFVAEGGPPRAAESLAKEEIVYAGHPVAIVLAETEGAASEAATLVEVDADPLPAVMSPEAAMAPDSPLVRVLSQVTEDAAEAALHGVGGGAEEEETETEQLSANVSGQTTMGMGDIDQGFAEADFTAEGTFHTAWVHQGYIEPQTCTVVPDGMGGITIHASTQGLFRTRQVVAQTLGLSQQQVRVVAMPVGGGFGGKFGLIEPLAAGASLAVGRPVRLAFTRIEEMSSSNPTPACTIQVKVGAKKDGTLTALQSRLVVDTGAYPNSPMGAAAFAIAGCYHIPNLDIRGYEVMTNRLGPGAYRAPGNPQASFAVESVIEDLAGKLGMDSIELRLRNAPVEGDARPDGPAWPRIGLKECLEHLRDHPLWKSRTNGPSSNGRVVEGIGVGIGGWRGGLEPASAICQMDPEGIINVVVGSVDLTGTFTTMRLIAAETMGVDYDLIRVIGSDSSNAPYAGGAGGSKIVYTVGEAVRNAAEDAREQLLSLAADLLEAAKEDLEIAGDRVRVKGMPSGSASEVTLAQMAGKTTGMGAQHTPIAGRGVSAQRSIAPGFSAHLARVQVDLDTGEVHVVDYVATQDVGCAINPAAVEGQILGAVAQGIGWGLYEQLVHDDSGQVITGSLMDYALPHAHNVPNVETVLIEVPSPDGPFGARGVGEPPVIPVAAAIANAIHDATGVRLTQLPVTSQRLWQAMQNGAPARS